MIIITTTTLSSFHWPGEGEPRAHNRLLVESLNLSAEVALK